jgi:hypothetical protein
MVIRVSVEISEGLADTLHPTGTGADRIGAFDAGSVGGANKVLGRGGHQCTT